MHEIGHVFGVGDVERSIYDYTDNEVYSGYDIGEPTDDRTPEIVEGRSNSEEEYLDEWSVMANAESPEFYLEPANGQYFLFSIEELFTVNTDDRIVDGSD